MNVRITINMDNAAFESNDGAEELATVLRHLVDAIERFGTFHHAEMLNCALRDVNGNAVGSIEISE